MNGWRPFIIYFLNMVVGIGVSMGHVPVDQKDFLVESLADVIGYLIILISSIAAIIHAFKKPHHPVPHSPVVTPQVNPCPEKTPAYAESEYGTPPLR